MIGFDWAVGDRPGAKMDIKFKKKKDQAKSPVVSSGTRPQEPEALPGGFSPAGAIPGPKPSSEVAIKTPGQSPTQQFTSRQQGSVFQQKPAALQGRQIEYYVDRSQSRPTLGAVGTGPSPTSVGGVAKPLAIGGGRYGDYKKSLGAYSQWRQGT